MYTTLVWVALAGFMASVPAESPSWQSDYAIARKLGREQGKPLAVFIGSGKAGWNQLVKDGSLSKEAKQILTSEYVCMYVDAKEEAGKQLASSFDVSNGLGLILSDRSGKVQAFHHDGALPEKELVRRLERYSDPERVVRTTEGTATQRVSGYAPEWVPSYNGSIQPYTYSFGSLGRSC